MRVGTRCLFADEHEQHELPDFLIVFWLYFVFHVFYTCSLFCFFFVFSGVFLCLYLQFKCTVVVSKWTQLDTHFNKHETPGNFSDNDDFVQVHIPTETKTRKSFDREASPSPFLAQQQTGLVEIDFNKERIYFRQFYIIMKMRRPKMTECRIRILYNAMCQITDSDLAVTGNGQKGQGITRAQWQNFYQYANIEIFRDPKYAVKGIIEAFNRRRRKQTESHMHLSKIMNQHDSIYHEDRCLRCCRYCSCASMCNCWLNIWFGLRAILYKIFSHPILNALIDLTVWIGSLIVILQLSYPKELDTIGDVLVYVFLVEVTLRWIAFGKYFLADRFNVVDLIVVYLSWALDTLVHEKSVPGGNATNVIIAFRLLRCVRALATIPRFKLIISTSITVLSNLCILFSLEFCVFYIFGVVGMMVCFVSHCLCCACQYFLVGIFLLLFVFLLFFFFVLFCQQLQYPCTMFFV